MARRTSGPVARGPVPRDRTTYAKTARQPRPFPRSRHSEGNPLACACGMRGPKPYGKQHAFLAVARGPVPRDRSREKISSARMRLLSVGQEHLLLIRSGAGSRTTDVGRSAIAGDRPPRYGARKKRGGQAPALRIIAATLLPLLDFTKRCQRTIRRRNGTR